MYAHVHLFRCVDELPTFRAAAAAASVFALVLLSCPMYFRVERDFRRFTRHARIVFGK